MDPNAATTQASLEDRVFALEAALSSIGAALLAPNGWGDDSQLHQELYATVRRVLRGSAFIDPLHRREAQLEARESGGAQVAADAVLDTLRTQVAQSAERGVSHIETAMPGPPPPPA
jgi:hypothetical protein